MAHYQALNKCVTHTPMPFSYLDSMVLMAVDINIFKIQLTGNFHNMRDICSNQRSMVRLSPVVLKHQTGGLYAGKWMSVVKGKYHLEQARKAQKESRGIGLNARRWWVVNAMPLSLSCWERPGTHCIAG